MGGRLAAFAQMLDDYQAATTAMSEAGVATIPAARYGAIEVRPVLEMGGPG